MTSRRFDNYLKRLPREHYRGQAYVHWSLTIDHRRTGWLTSVFHHMFRELLTHTTFRYGLICPVYCSMPDHIHLMWIGLLAGSDQLNAMKYFRRHVNDVLRQAGVTLQSQAYDNVLDEDDREREAFAAVCEYIAGNPERKKLVGVGEFKEYEFTDCLIPGAPEVKFFHDRFWDTFWRIHSSLASNGLVRT